VKSFFIVYPLIFEFGFHNLLASALLELGLITFMFFFNYFMLAGQGQTFYDAKKSISRMYIASSWYGRLKEFLGPYPILQILFPFFPSPKISYEYIPEKQPKAEPAYKKLVSQLIM
jgi:hypothetical protein